MAEDTDKLPSSIQESIATAVCVVDDTHSRVIANTIDVNLFDPPFTDIIASCLEYRQEYGRPPGKDHIDDVFSDIFKDPNHKLYTQYDRIIRSMVRQADDLNTQYIRNRVQDFMHVRLTRLSLQKALKRYQDGGANLVPDIEDIFRAALHIRDADKRDTGFSMDEDTAFDFLDRNDNDFCKIGIRELDNHGVHPARGELLLFIAARNRGKSFFLTHCGKFGFLKGWRVLHYTLENSAAMTAQRYWQTLFTGVRHEGTYQHPYFEPFEKDPSKATLQTKTLKPNFTIARHDETLRYLREERRKWDGQLDNLRIRSFPSGRLTFSALERDLDTLATVHRFEPDAILLDMPQLMKIERGSMQNYEALDDLVTNLRGLAVERNLAMVIPQQGNRAGERVSTMQGHHGSGSIGMLGIADNAITYSQTPAEEAHNLARLYSQKVRNDKARDIVLITQHYPSGQFCMDSWYLTDQIQEEKKRYTAESPAEQQDGDEDFEEHRKYASGKKS